MSVSDLTPTEKKNSVLVLAELKKNPTVTNFWMGQDELFVTVTRLLDAGWIREECQNPYFHTFVVTDQGNDVLQKWSEVAVE